MPHGEGRTACRKKNSKRAVRRRRSQQMSSGPSGSGRRSLCAASASSCRRTARGRHSAVLDAIHLAAATGAELTLLMVVDYNKNVAAFEQVSLGGYVPAELKVAAYRFLADLMHLIPSEIRAQPRVEAGDPRELIVSVAEEEESDLIVMGSRGFGTFRSLLVGSVSRFVLEQAPCPVLLVKGLPDDWDEEQYTAPLA